MGIDRNDPYNNLLQRFSYYTECELATMEQALSRKRTAKCDLQRHDSIVCGMIAACVEHGVNAERAKGWRHGRVAEVLTDGYDRFRLARELGSRSLVDAALLRSRGAKRRRGAG